VLDARGASRGASCKGWRGGAVADFVGRLRPADEAAWALAKTGMKEADDALQAAGLPSLARIVAQAYWRPQP